MATEQKQTEQPLASLASGKLDGVTTWQDAKQKGLKYYFTGVPCKHGHLSTRFVSSRVCVECHKTVYNAINKKARKKYRKNRKKRVKNGELKKTYWSDNPCSKGHVGERYTANYECCECSKDRILRSLTPEKNRKAQRKWYKNNKRKAIVYQVNRKIQQKNATGNFTFQDIERLLNIQKGKCYWCRETNLKDGYHIDHIIPLSKGGSNNSGNLCISCPECNLSKGAKMPSEYIGRLF